MTIRSVLIALVLALSPLAAASETVGTLTLDGLSFVSFEHIENLPLPPGSTIKFRFGEVAADGSCPFTIDPTDVAIAPIALGTSPGTLAYGLGSGARGEMRRVDGALSVTFEADVEAKLEQPEGGGARSYALSFTTGSASASNVARSTTVQVDGMPVVQGPNYVQLVGAATNKPDAFPQPGTAVYAVLSGSFDWIPELP